ncbi:MAG: 5-(carboxyamino)imidazole ribonucleotide mutase [Sedimentisphaerales bacterium]|jgi:phosphoribosylaminoimidazole carboxylase PurE protein|nr:5-(carboxyamino)imidazole ribonucleotide mutase [Sedimentisphaerales bacterium]
MSQICPKKVAVVMGSDSDLPVMQEAIDQLRRLGIEPVPRILSAHRAPEPTAEFARDAHSQGIGVIIAAAGMAAHLAGTLASRTTLPVIGVPLDSGGGLGGIDALLSTVQMPPGVPVATVGIGKAGARNAAILAAQILALSSPELQSRLAQLKDEQLRQVMEKDAALRRTGLGVA